MRNGIKISNTSRMAGKTLMDLDIPMDILQELSTLNKLQGGLR